ncbi:hypothetical protein DY000_02047815 [Brassica cretica]|uniref:Uncharacterized protein n=1 Tax=Brassica cretica TaxID=69181 RepID=A0ABQ7ESB6_BRACR|nr:hypothetical protein DY000_02047815 [Brassica cretica]
MVMAVNGARVIARWELMREWLKEQSNQWDLAKALEQYKARADECCASNLSVGVEKTLRGSSCKIRAAWALGDGTPWNPRTRRLFLGNPWLLDPEARPLSVPVGISYSAARNLATIEFPCCTL